MSKNVQSNATKTDSASRTVANSWYWSKHDKSTYECPDCGRKQDRVSEFHIHHKDGNPQNNDPDNLVGLCHRCHMWRHRTGPTISGLDTEEWKEAFLKLGELEEQQ